MTAVTERQWGSLYFLQMATTISPTPQALLKCDLATCSWSLCPSS